VRVFEFALVRVFGWVLGQVFGFAFAPLLGLWVFVWVAQLLPFLLRALLSFLRFDIPSYTVLYLVLAFQEIRLCVMAPLIRMLLKVLLTEILLPLLLLCQTWLWQYIL